MPKKNDIPTIWGFKERRPWETSLAEENIRSQKTMKFRRFGVKERSHSEKNFGQKKITVQKKNQIPNLSC